MISDVEQSLPDQRSVHSPTSIVYRFWGAQRFGRYATLHIGDVISYYSMITSWQIKHVLPHLADEV